MFKHNLTGLLLLCLLSPIVKSDPQVSIDTQFYDLAGTTPQQIRNSIQGQGPVGQSGKRFHAQTEWDVNWSYRWIQSKTFCRITHLDVEVNIEYLLPRLTQLDQLKQPQKDRWNQYYSALFHHEQQHKDHGLQAAGELEQQIQAIQQQVSCNKLDSLIAETAQKVLDKYDALERDFDRRTEHGKLQGVIFPW